MKKLIEELQTEIERRKLKDIALEGLPLALQIVKSYDPWIDVSELPPREAHRSYSIDVLVRDGTSKPFTVAYYSYEQKKWKWEYDFSCKVTHWTYLPEVKR